MVVCQFFLRGTCKFGNQCRNEHPQNAQGDRSSAFSGSTWTPTNVQKTIPYSLETMTKDFDFKADKPSWPLSSYGPAKNEKNLLSSLDESSEELRFKAVTAARNGNINEYFQYEQNAFTNADQIFANVRNDTKAAFEAAKRNSLGTDASSSLSVFPGSGSSSAFGAGGPSTFGQPSAFGAPSSGSTSAFGQPRGASAFGTPAFGQTSSAFSQPAVAKPNFGGAPANSGGFSAFAGPGPSAFATAATTSTTGSVFGQSAFSGSEGGAKPAQSAFGAVNSTSTSSAFGRPSAFGASSGPAFGQTSPFGTSSNTASTFGQPTSAPTPTFGQTPTAPSSSPTTAPFGQPAPVFGQPTPATSAFSRPVATTAFGQPTTQTSAFGAPVAPQQSAFGQVVSPSRSTAAPKPQAKSAAPDFVNAKSTYRPGLDPYDALLPANYSSLLPDDVRAAFAAPRFSWDNVPDWIPPLDMR